jgi:hypothetical protein
MTSTTDHLTALEAGLSRERARFAAATSAQERAMRAVWVRQYEREIRDEMARLGLVPDASIAAMSADELAEALK